jgi:hypothetical protein
MVLGLRGPDSSFPTDVFIVDPDTLRMLDVRDVNDGTLEVGGAGIGGNE